jgi:hypothetical protein
MICAPEIETRPPEPAQNRRRWALQWLFGAGILFVHYSKAVRVNIQCMTAGYLALEDVQICRRRIAKVGKSDIVIECDAVIVGGRDQGWFNKHHFGVCLDLPIDDV